MSKAPAPPRGLSVYLKTARGRTTASQGWLQRQLNDPYVRAAQAQGYRSRAAFKLIELDERYKLIKKGARVLDLGAAPGGWSQVAVQRGAGKVVGLDLLPIDAPAGTEFIQGDFQDPGIPEKLRRCWVARLTWSCRTWRRIPPAIPPPTTSASSLWPNWRSTLPWRCWRPAADLSAKSCKGAPNGNCWCP